jgi:hypothetical protein
VENWGKAIYEIFKETSTKQIRHAKSMPWVGLVLLFSLLALAKLK